MPYNFTLMRVNSISFGSPHVRPMGRVRGEPSKFNGNTHPKNVTALFRDKGYRDPASLTRAPAGTTGQMAAMMARMMGPTPAAAALLDDVARHGWAQQR